MYGNMIGEENAYLYRTSLYLAASASAEFFADIGLCAFEAMKVRIQTAPGFTTSMTKCASIIAKDEGMAGFYKGIVPLWGRQIPYTMMKVRGYYTITPFSMIPQFLFVDVNL